MGGDGFAAANGVHAFVGFGFEVDLFGGNAKSFGKRLAHLRKVRAELWFFGEDHRGDMLDRKFFLREQLWGVLQKEQAVRAFPFRIAVREMWADVAESRRAEQSVAERVGEHVAVGMADGPLVERQLDAADHELSPFRDRKSTRLNSSHGYISYAVFCLKKKKKTNNTRSSYQASSVS